MTPVDEVAANSPTGAASKLNRMGLSRSDYQGMPSTLCAGCGHNSISSQIIQSAFELALKPHEVIKLSGIGCSSKSPAYFLNRAYGINTLHGRMPSVATGAMLANHKLKAIGVSGDGDTGSIGLGQYKHLLRRNVPMVYIIENNGVYGLTKGQFSATADIGQTLKRMGTNEFMPLDLCLEAIIAGGGFVARSFAGDAAQVRELLKAAMSYQGTAVLDIISPCVVFNNHEDSTKSYRYGKEHEEVLQDINFIPAYEEVSVEQEHGTVQEVELHGGARLLLKKLGRGHDPTDKGNAIQLLLEAREKQEFVTGLLYINESSPTLNERYHLLDTPLSQLAEPLLRPTPERFSAIMAEFTEVDLL